MSALSIADPQAPPGKCHVLHAVFRFDVGGLENVIVQLINRLPPDRFEHTVLSLTTVSDFRQRVQVPGVRFIALNKPPGHAWRLYPRVIRLLRELRPQVLHTCNIAPLELAPLAWLAGVPRRIHVEHGWDAQDPDGRNPRYRWLRRLYRPFVNRFVSVSDDLDRYLAHAVGVPAARRSLVANGVDADRFQPGVAAVPAGFPFTPGRHWIVGTVGRLMTVKNQPLLARAFVALLRDRPELAETARLVIVGDGPLGAEVRRTLEEAGHLDRVWMPGARADIPDILRTLNAFVLPSQAEGTSCTLQEAMACACPVVATRVGGNAAVLGEGTCGLLVPSDDAAAMSAALQRLHDNPSLARQMGEAARQRVLRHYSLTAMVDAYARLFDGEPHLRPA